MTTQLTDTMLDRLWPKAPHTLKEQMILTQDEVFAKCKINTNLRLAHFMAQLSHESGGGVHKEEGLTYTSAARIAQVWPSRFSVASAAAYVRNPQALANKVYGGRMGNVNPGDGFAFRGRGLIQITGRDAYAAVGKLIGLDLEEKPMLTNSSETALLVAGGVWIWKNCNPPADANNISKVTKLINGGQIGLADRTAWFGKWRRVLGD